MPSSASHKAAEPEPSSVRSSWTAGKPFISIAFMAALLFGPLVIATGLLTTHAPEGAAAGGGVAPSEISLADLRPSLDADLPRREPAQK